MDQSQNNLNPPVRTKQPASRKVLLVILAILVVAGTAAAVYFWQQGNVDSVQNKLNEANNKIETLNKIPDSNKQLPQSQEQTTKFSTTNGKFSLDLPSKYAVVVEQDGPGGGGPAASIRIVNRTDKPSVFSESVDESFKVVAHGLNRSTFDALVQSTLAPQSSTEHPQYRKNAPITIDGVQAESQTLANGMFETKHVFFTKNNQFYHITMDDSTIGNAKLEEFTKGFKFN